MGIREAGKALLAGGVVYVAMAACSAAPSASGPLGALGGGGAGSDAATGGQGGAAGVPEAGLDGFAEAFADALTDPVGEAMAGDAGAAAQVDVEPCNVTVGQAVYAEHAYPGRSVAELSALRAVGHYRIAVDGFTDSQTDAVLRSGKVRAVCGVGTASTYDSITFALPL